MTVGKAVERVEAEVARWECNNYVHITRATAVQGKAIQLQTIFSKPGQDTPVPVAVVQVNFLLDTKKDTLTFRFEHQSVRYTVGTTGLAKGKFEVWLDRIVADKLKVKQLTTLSTPFEESRLASFSLHTQAEEVPKTAEQTVHEVDQGPEPDAPPSASKTETSASADKSTSKPPALDANFGPSQNEAAGTADDGTLSMSALLVAIFDAADEEDEHELTHKEVADLLYATPLGLSDWDIKLLLTQALELETGKIQYLPFVEDAPHIIEALVKRRAAYEARRKPGHSVPPESIDLCFGEEIEEVSRAAREAFGEMDKASKGTLSRNEFRSCLQSRSERFSMQEVHMLMQMCKEDEDGQVPYDDFSALLQQLRIAALSNAMVETDVAALRIQLILMLREEGLADDNIMYIWSLRRVLLHAKQICLSRMQIHVILCILQPNEHGEVDAQYFLDVCCTVIPHLYDIAVFEEKASTIAKDKADAQAKQELEELQGLQRNLTMQHVRAQTERTTQRQIEN